MILISIVLLVKVADTSVSYSIECPIRCKIAGVNGSKHSLKH